MDDIAAFRVNIEGTVAWLTLCRPKKRNTMGMAFFNQLDGHFHDFDADPDIRVVVICAEGPDFSAGLDLTEAGSLLNGTGADDRERLRQTILDIQQSITAVERCRKPVIAAVHGHCIGGGVDLLAACDIRMAAADAIFSIRETRLGIIADLGTLQRLPHIIGQGWFRELALTGRDFTAAEALQMGFVTRIAENRQTTIRAAGDLAGEIAALAPLTVQGVKDVINFSRDSGVHSGLIYVAQKNAAALPSRDLVEALSAFAEKRDPHFRGK